MASTDDPLSGVSELMQARYRSDQARIDELLSEDPQLDVFEAAALGDTDRLADLLEGDPALAAARSADGFTPLHLSAFFGQPEAVRRLLDAGAEVDPRGSGWMRGTPLHSAASGRHPEVVAILLDAGAEPDARQSGGWTPLHSAAANGDLASVERLLEADADADAVNDDRRSVKDLAEESGGPEVVARIDQALSDG